MGKGTKFILLIIVLTIVGLAIYVGIQEKNKENSNSKNNTVSNSVNQSSGNKIENTVVDNNVVTEPQVEPIETPENIINSTTISEEDKAKELAKIKWGGSEGVYFAIDNINSNETYVVSVRDSATTKVLEWYTVDIKTGTVTN